MNFRKNDLLKFAHSVLVAETNMARVAEKQEKSFEESIKGQKFKHPETKNDVSFGSLPAEEQKKIREEFNKSNPKEELSKDDQKALDALDGLDLDSDDLAKLLEEAVAEMDLSDPPDLSELKGMDSDELEGQAESLLKNYDKGLDALSKAIEDYDDGDDDDDDDDDYDDGIDRVLNKEVKLDKKSEEHFNEIENLVISEALSLESLQSLVEGLVGDAQDDDFDDLLDVGFDDFDADELTKIMKAVFSKDKEVAGEVNVELRKNIVEQVIESEDYPTDDSIGEEIESMLGGLREEAFEDDVWKNVSIEVMEKAKEANEKAIKIIKDRFKEVKKSLEEKFGGDEELIDEALVKLGFEPTADLDNKKELEEMLEEYGVALSADFDNILAKKKRIQEIKSDNAKAEAERAKAKAERAKAKAEEEKAKAEKAEKAKEKVKDKSYRDEAKQKSLDGLDSVVKNLDGFGDVFSYADTIENAYDSLYSDYGVKNFDDLSNLDDDALNDFIESVQAVDKSLTEKMNTIRNESNKEKAKAEKDLKKNKARLKELAPRLKKLDKITADQWSDLEDNYPEKHKKLADEFDALDDEIKKLQDENRGFEEIVGYADRVDLRSAITAFSDFANSDFGAYDMLVKAQGIAGNRKEQKELEEAKKKEEEEHKQKVKEYTKKINDLISEAEKSDSAKVVTDLFGEFGRMKGQLTGGKVFDEVKGDLDKAEKALKDAQERNSFAGKLKSFFGLGKGKKKASQAQKDKVAKIALEILKEEIALYKEEEANRKR